MSHNYFTVRSGGETRTAHNQIETLTEGYRTGQPVTAYLAVLSGGEVRYVLPAPIAGYNADVNAGRLYVRRSAVLDVLTAGEGATFDGVGFTPDGSGTILINRASFEPVRAEVGKPLYLTGTLYVDAAQMGGTLTAGDNPLVRALLGLEGLKTDAFTLGKGFCRHPNVPVYTDAGRLEPQGSCTAAFSGQSLTVEGRAQNVFETVVCYEGAPVLRMYDSRVSGAGQVTRIADAGGYVYLGDAVLSASNVRAGGTATNAFTAFTVPERYVACCPAVFGAALPFNAKAVGEPTGNAAAVVGGRETFVLLSDGYAVREAMRVPVVGDASVASDGTLFLVSEGTLTVYSPDGSGYRTLQTGFSSVTAAAVTGTGTDGVYFVCVVSGGTLYQYRFDGKAFTQLFAPRPAADARLYAFTPRLIVMTGAETAVLSASGESAPLAAVLAAAAALGGLTIGHNGLFLAETTGGAALCDLFGGGAADAGTDAVFFKNAALSGGRMLARLPGSAPAAVPSDVDLTGVTGGATLGRYTLLIRNGRAEFIYESPGGLALYLPDHAGKSITAMAVDRDPAYAAATVRAVLTFNG